MKPLRWTLLPLLLAFAAPAAVLAQTTAPLVAAGPGVCGGFSPMANGPHDYRVVRDRRLASVENYHFTADVENLRKGASTNVIGADIAFTLRHFPNHHRALLAMIRLSERAKTPQPSGSEYTVDCWLDRAIRFAQDDTVTRMIYADYLRRTGREAAAMAQLERTVVMAGENAFTHYNAGLIFLEMKQFERALTQAHRALALGLQRTELRDRLQSAGQWKDASATPPAAASAASAAAAPPAASAASAAIPAASAVGAAR